MSTSNPAIANPAPAPTQRRGLPQIPPFSITADPATVAHRWRVWTSLLNTHILFDEIPAAKQKLTLLLVIGPELHLQASALATNEASYDDVIKGLTAKLSEHRTKEEYRFLFMEARQTETETLKEYFDRLKLLADQGQYDTPLDVVRSQLENGCRSKIVQRTLMSANHLPLTDAITIATREEATDRRTTELEKREQTKAEAAAQPTPPAAVQWVGPDPYARQYTQPQHGRPPRHPHQRQRPQAPSPQSWRHPPRYTAWPPQQQQPPQGQWRHTDPWSSPPTASTQRACYNCGIPHPPAYGPGPSLHCPARGHQCRVCSKWNHFESVCFTARRAPPPYQQLPPPSAHANNVFSAPMPAATTPNTTPLQALPTTCDDLLDLSEAVQSISLSEQASWGDFDVGYDTQEPTDLLLPFDTCYDDQIPADDSHIWGIHAVNATSAPRRPHPTCHVLINGQSLTAIIDTGAHINVMPVAIYRTLRMPPPLAPPTDQLFQFGASTPMVTHGTFSATITTDRLSTNSVLHVTEQGSDLLLGFDTLRALDIVRIVTSVSTVVPTPPPPDLTALSASFSNLFQGMGLLRDYTVTPHIDPTVQPVALPPTAAPVPSCAALKGNPSRSSSNAAASKDRPPPPHGLLPGDSVLLRKDRPPNKLSTPYHLDPLLVTNAKGSMVSASRGGRPVTRHASWFRRLPPTLPAASPPGGGYTRPPPSTPSPEQALPYRAQITQALPPPPPAPQQPAPGAPAAVSPSGQHPHAVTPPPGARASSRLRQPPPHLRDLYQW